MASKIQEAAKNGHVNCVQTVGSTKKKKKRENLTHDWYSNKNRCVWMQRKTTYKLLDETKRTSHKHKLPTFLLTAAANH